MLTKKQKKMLTAWARSYEKPNALRERDQVIPFWDAVSVIPDDLYAEIEAVRPSETFYQDVNSFIASRDWERVGI